MSLRPATAMNQSLAGPSECDESGQASRDHCCCRSTTKRAAIRSSGLGLSLVGAVGWLTLPKCPLCLAAYFAFGTGISLSVTQSRGLYLALLGFAAGSFTAGVFKEWRRRGWHTDESGDPLLPLPPV